MAMTVTKPMPMAMTIAMTMTMAMTVSMPMTKTMTVAMTYGRDRVDSLLQTMATLSWVLSPVECRLASFTWVDEQANRPDEFGADARQRIRLWSHWGRAITPRSPHGTPELVAALALRGQTRASSSTGSPLLVDADCNRGSTGSSYNGSSWTDIN